MAYVPKHAPIFFITDDNNDGSIPLYSEADALKIDPFFEMCDYSYPKNYRDTADYEANM